MTDSPEQHWRRLSPLIDELLELPPERRAAFSERACAGDPALLAALTRWLAALEASEGFLENSRTDEVRRDTYVGPDFETLSPGHRIGNYEVDALLGRGGMGDVYAASRADGQFEHQVAIKIINASLAHETEQFLAERRILARLEHPGITRMFDGGLTEDGRPYMVMELVKGEDLIDYCDTRDLNLAQRLQLFMQLCEAVGYAHRNLIVHRDIKPRNVLVDEAGNVKLLDFGIAQLIGAVRVESGSDSLRLTPSYSAPEQISGGIITTATDVYALGCLLYRLLTGEPALDLAGLPMALAVERVLNEIPQLASQAAAAEINPPVPEKKLRGDIDAIIAKAIAKDPAHRYGGAMSLLQDITRFVHLRPVDARGGGAAYQLGKFIRRNRLLTAAAATVSATVLVAIVMIVNYAARVRDERDVALYEASSAEDVKDYLLQLFKIAGENSGPNQMTVDQLLGNQRRQIEAAPSSAQSIHTLRILGELYLTSHDNASALAVITTYLKAAGAQAASADLGAAHLDLAVVHERLGDAKQALAELALARGFWKADPTRFRAPLLSAQELEAQILLDAGDTDQALYVIHAAIAQCAAMYGDDDLQMAILDDSLATALQSKGHYEAALAADTRAWKLLQTIGRDHSADGLNVLNNLAVAAKKAGHIDEAAANYRQAVRLRRTIFGASSSLAALLNNYGQLLTEHGNAAEALPLLQEAEQMSARYSGDQSFLHSACGTTLGYALIELHDYPEAEQRLRPALETARAVMGDDHLQTGKAEMRLGQALFAQHHDVEARALFARADATFTRLGAPAQQQKSILIGLEQQYLPDATTVPRAPAADKARSAP